MQAIEERIVDRPVLKLLRALLRAGVMEGGVVRGSVTGTPQGGVVSVEDDQCLFGPLGHYLRSGSWSRPRYRSSAHGCSPLVALWPCD